MVRVELGHEAVVGLCDGAFPLHVLEDARDGLGGRGDEVGHGDGDGPGASDGAVDEDVVVGVFEGVLNKGIGGGKGRGDVKGIVVEAGDMTIHDVVVERRNAGDEVDDVRDVSCLEVWCIKGAVQVADVEARGDGVGGKVVGVGANMLKVVVAQCAPGVVCLHECHVRCRWSGS